MVKSELKLRTSKMCCHMVRDMERRQLKLRALNSLLPLHPEYKRQADIYWPCCQPMAHGYDMVCQNFSHLQLGFNLSSTMTVHSPSWALRHSMGPADHLCARTALVPSGSESQDQLCMLAKSSSPRVGCWHHWHLASHCCLVMQLWLHKWG